MRRRTFLRVTGVTATGALAGCASSGDSETATPGDDEVLVGPNGRYVFQPDPLTVSAGTTVTWRFQSPNHNVSCRPDGWDSASLPEGAEPFASYEAGNSYETRQEGETFEHTFEVPGTYDYICTPHVANGMVGTVVVEE
ncbi:MULTISPECIES: plastocyanin/azurin family copper-binding protein [Halomicrobium]|uniref:Blue (Type 1) copper domain protein n=2 Tax=Halomicrobium mukohataei TaxID=57705 RepID=C7P1C5_HALMD|nr:MULTISPECIES: plastocyanin/azurin family copper-binding protein [Halomicrobium]ACV47133.1 blue (type 1) copper domain protein [Halomicrobium mukohataei DSM 12286]QCD65615.1 plastocyanin [Halomicrobium mukohataei]QFR20421.1 plastocyanin [Halomicrobium sp. ZPS1]